MADERSMQPDPGLAENWTHAGRCLRSVTHDVNNHLGAVLAYSELIALELEGKPELTRMLEDIVHGVQESSTLLDTLTALVSRDEMIVEQIDLTDLMRRLIALFRHEWKRMGVNVEVQLPDERTPLFGVRVRLIRALVHVFRYATEMRRAARPAPLGILLRRVPSGYEAGIGSLSRDESEAEAPLDADDGLEQARIYVESHRGTLHIHGNGTVVIVFPHDTGLELAPE